MAQLLPVPARASNNEDVIRYWVAKTKVPIAEAIRREEKAIGHRQEQSTKSTFNHWQIHFIY